MAHTPSSLASAPARRRSALARVLECAGRLPRPATPLLGALSGALATPAALIGAVQLDRELCCATLAAARVRHGAVDTLPEAWARFGDEVMRRHLADAALVLHAERLPMPLCPQERPRRWDHAFATAGAMAALAERSGRVRPWVAATVGALHVVGAAGIEMALRSTWPRSASCLALGDTDLPTIERLLDLSRFRVAGAVLGAWRLPALLWQGVARQRAPGNHPVARMLESSRRAAAAAGFPVDAHPCAPALGTADAVGCAAEAVDRYRQLRRVLCGR